MRYTRSTLRSFLVLALLLAGAARGIPTPDKSPVPHTGKTPEKPATETETAGELLKKQATGLDWQTDLKTANLRATAEYKTIFAFFSSPSCPYCHKMLDTVFTDPEVAELMAAFILFKVDVSEDEGTARRFGIQGIPVTVLLSSDGREHGRVNGFVNKEDLIAILKRALDPTAEVVEKPDDVAALIERIKSDGLEAGDWVEVLTSLGKESGQRNLREVLLGQQPFPASTLVSLLSHEQLPVRLGALELLEEISGEHFAFDPWIAHAEDPVLQRSLSDWAAWAEQRGDTTNTYRFARMTNEQQADYIRDVVSKDEQRAFRALRMLEQGDEATVKALRAFADSGATLSDHDKLLLQEVEFSIRLNALNMPDAPSVSHRLLTGNPDVRMHLIREISRKGPDAMPTLAAFLKDKDSLIRETAIEAMLVAGGKSAVRPVSEHLKEEKNVDVLIAGLRGFGNVRTVGSARVVSTYLQHEVEDVAIMALRSIEKLRSDRFADQLKPCLQDPRWRVRATAISAVQKVNATQLAEDVGALLEDEDEFVRFNAVAAYASLAKAKAKDKLVELVKKDANLLPPVIAAWRGFGEALSEDILAQIDTQPAEKLLTILESIGSLGLYGSAAAIIYIDHEDLDVRCAALRIVSQTAMHQPEVKERLIAVLLKQVPEEARAIISNLQIPSRHDWGYSRNNIEIEDLYEEDTPTVQADAPDAGDPLGDLFDAFGDAPTEDTPASAAQTPTSPTQNAEEALFEAFLGKETPAKPTLAVNLDGLISAFGFGEAPGTETATADAPRLSWLTALKPYLDQEEDTDLRLDTAVILAQMRYKPAVPVIATYIDETPIERKAELLEAIKDIPSEDSFSLLASYLADPNEQLRRSAGNTIIESQNLGLVAQVTDELLRPDTPLKAYEVFDYSLSEAMESYKVKKQLRTWAESILEATDTHSAEQMIGAIYVLGNAWSTQHKKLFQPLLTADDPYLRRAAWQIYAQNNRLVSDEEWTQLVEDPSDKVRGIFFAKYGDPSYRLQFYFNEKKSTYTSGVYNNGTAPKAHILDLLNRLTKDTAPSIRLEAMLALLRYKQEVPPDQLQQAMKGFRDQRAIASRMEDFLSEGDLRLEADYAFLLEWVDRTTMSEYTLKEVDKVFVEAVLANEDPENDPAGQTVQARSENATESLSTRIVYFYEIGCPECEETRLLLDQYREIFPELVVEAHDIAAFETVELSERLSNVFNIPGGQRQLTPTLIAGGGTLIRKQINEASLGDLISRSMGIPDSAWYTLEQDALDDSDDETDLVAVAPAIPVPKTTESTPVKTTSAPAVKPLVATASAPNMLRSTLLIPLGGLAVLLLLIRGNLVLAGISALLYTLGMLFRPAAQLLGPLHLTHAVAYWVIAFFLLIICLISIRTCAQPSRPRTRSLYDAIKNQTPLLSSRAQRWIVLQAFPAGLLARTAFTHAGPSVSTAQAPWLALLLGTLFFCAIRSERVLTRFPKSSELFAGLASGLLLIGLVMNAV